MKWAPCSYCLCTQWAPPVNQPSSPVTPLSSQEVPHLCGHTFFVVLTLSLLLWGVYIKKIKQNVLFHVLFLEFNMRFSRFIHTVFHTVVCQNLLLYSFLLFERVSVCRSGDLALWLWLWRTNPGSILAILPDQGPLGHSLGLSPALLHSQLFLKRWSQVTCPLTP
jgi:hypothetical protein